MRLIALALVALTGCSLVKELKAPPFPVTVLHHTRAVGLEANIPNYTGDSILKVRFGFFSDSWELIPCSTNPIYAPTISDTFTLGGDVGLSLDTHIAEDIQTGWTGPAPSPRLKVFNTNNAPGIR